jgi:tRNA-uridine 2-sulfurtransferase
VPDSSGELVTTSGEVIGRHSGVQNFTVGQRKGLGVESPTALSVIQIGGEGNQVKVGNEADLMQTTLRARRLNWITIPELRGEMRVKIKIRHRHEPAWATIRMDSNDELLAIFDEPARAVTPGQAAVFYDGDEVVGGGWIA